MTIGDTLARDRDGTPHAAPGALAAARASAASHGAFLAVSTDQQIPTGVDGPLAGVPFAVKDNIDTADLPTTAGTAALRGSQPDADAPVVALLRDAGAVLIGKTNMHEYAFGVTNNNASFGPARNPADESRSPGGSSGGSAVAVALGIVPFALGTDTGGSVRVPASHCGVAGYRPSTARYPGGGLARLSSTRDTVGLFATSVGDLALVDAVITGRSPAVPATATADLHGMRLGIPVAGFFDGLDPQVEHVVQRTLAQLEHAGATLVDVDLSQVIEIDQRCGFPISFYEAAREIPRYVAGLGERYRSLSLAEIAEAAQSPDVADILGGIAADLIDDTSYRDALAGCAQIRIQCGEAFAEHQLTALAYPTVPLLPPPLGDDETTLLRGQQVPVFTTSVRNVAPSTLSGAPGLSLPAGRSVEDLPIGLSLEALPGQDRALLRVGARVEAALIPDQDSVP